MVEGKVQYTVSLLKEGQATYFFINDKLVCSFNESELAGYATLGTFEFTSCSDVWRDGGAYAVSYLDVLISGNSTEVFKKYKALIA